MPGPFSKNMPLTPAQQQLQQVGLQGAANYAKTWQPLQGYFANRLTTDAPAATTMARGAAATGSRSAGMDALDSVLGRDRSTGAGIGSGKYVTDASGGLDATAAGTAGALTQAQSAGEGEYAKGLQDVVRMGMQDQSMAQGGLQNAANTEAQEQAAQEQAQQGMYQGIGEAIGQGGGLALKLAAA